MAKTLKKPTWEGIKEIARLAIFAIIAWAITQVSGLPETEGTAAILAVLRFVDKWLHEHPTSRVPGLTPF